MAIQGILTGTINAAVVDARGGTHEEVVRAFLVGFGVGAAVSGAGGYSVTKLVLEPFFNGLTTELGANFVARGLIAVTQYAGIKRAMGEPFRPGVAAVCFVSGGIAGAYFQAKFPDSSGAFAELLKAQLKLSAAVTNPLAEALWDLFEGFFRRMAEYGEEINRTSGGPDGDELPPSGIP